MNDDPWRAFDLSQRGLVRFVRVAQQVAGLRGEVDVLLCDDRRMRRLNREFRGKDKTTDVLSFPVAKELKGEFAGDLAVSLETAQRQAVAHKHTLKVEVRILILHGLLHLHGLDHESDAGEMAALEMKLRKRLRLPNGLIARAQSGVAA